jgi:hypothetical protein
MRFGVVHLGLRGMEFQGWPAGQMRKQGMKM